MGQKLLVLGHYSDAAHHLAEAVRLTPESAEAHLVYGMAVGQEGMAVEAEKQFREALRIQPDLLKARENLGIALMKEGRSFEALHNSKKFFNKVPRTGWRWNTARTCAAVLLHRLPIDFRTRCR